MSDPVSNAEIEDVLSSIRRLVAGDRDDIPEQGEAPEDTAKKIHPEEPEALVLTASLRVEEEPMPSEEVSDHEARVWDEDAKVELDEAVEEVVPEPPERSLKEVEPDCISEPVLTDRDLTEVGPDLAEFEDDLVGPIDTASPDDPEAEMELPSFVRPKLDDAGNFSQEDGAFSVDDLAKDEATEVETTEPETVEYPEAWQVEAEADPPRNAPRAGFMFGSIRDEDLVEKDEPLEQEETPEDILTDVEETLPVVEAEEEVAPVSREPESSGEETLDEAPHEAVVEELPEEEALPDLAEALPEAEEILAEAVESMSEETKDETTDELPEAPENLFAETGAMPDEAALRDLIAELLHRELQGPLGERITRNVRKLVRREIHRALAARDFD